MTHSFKDSRDDTITYLIDKIPQPKTININVHSIYPWFQNLFLSNTTCVSSYVYSTVKHLLTTSYYFLHIADSINIKFLKPFIFYISNTNSSHAILVLLSSLLVNYSPYQNLLTYLIHLILVK